MMGDDVVLMNLDEEENFVKPHIKFLWNIVQIDFSNYLKITFFILIYYLVFW
jgi:hypothetical protein